MSSTLRHFSQIPVRTKYLLAVSDYSYEGEASEGGLFGNGGAGVITVSLGIRGIGPTATVDEISAYATSESITLTTASVTSGQLFKDLGRQLTVYDSTVDGDLHIATYRECQFVGGAGSEGVSNTAPYWEARYYLRVWAADGTGVVFARTG